MGPREEYEARKIGRWRKKEIRWMRILGFFSKTVKLAFKFLLPLGTAFILWKTDASIERQSYAGRAFLFMNYQYVPATVPLTQQTSGARVNIGLCIENAGQSPAIISDFKFTLRLSARREGESGENLFDGRAVGFAELFKDKTFSPETAAGVLDAGHVIAASTSSCIKQTFVFQNIRATSLGFSELSGYIEYRDMWGNPRHSWYCAELHGTGAFPKNAGCYHWD